MSFFIFHLIILIVLGIIFIQIALNSKKKDILIPLFGMIGLFAFHCLYWGEVCTVCDLTNPVCLIEVGLFWFFALWGLLIWRRSLTHPN